MTTDIRVVIVKTSRNVPMPRQGKHINWPQIFRESLLRLLIIPTPRQVVNLELLTQPPFTLCIDSHTTVGDSLKH